MYRYIFFGWQRELDTGIGIHYRDLALTLKRQGHEVRVYQFPYEFIHDASSVFEGIQVSRFGIQPTNLFKIRGIGRLCRIFKYLIFTKPPTFQEIKSGTESNIKGT